MCSAPCLSAGSYPCGLGKDRSQDRSWAGFRVCSAPPIKPQAAQREDKQPFISDWAPCTARGLALRRARTRGAARRARCGDPLPQRGLGVSRPPCRRQRGRQLGLPQPGTEHGPSQPGRALPPHPLISNKFHSTIPSCLRKAGQGRRTGGVCPWSGAAGLSAIPCRGTSTRPRRCSRANSPWNSRRIKPQ